MKKLLLTLLTILSFGIANAETEIPLSGWSGWDGNTSYDEATKTLTCASAWAGGQFGVDIDASAFNYVLFQYEASSIAVNVNVLGWWGDKLTVNTNTEDGSDHLLVEINDSWAPGVYHIQQIQFQARFNPGDFIIKKVALISRAEAVALGYVKDYQAPKTLTLQDNGRIAATQFNGLSDDALVEFTYNSEGGANFVNWGPGILASLKDKGTNLPGSTSKMNIKNEGENKFTYELRDLKPLLDEPSEYNEYGLFWNLWGFTLDGNTCTNTRIGVKAYELEGFAGKGYRAPDTEEDESADDEPVIQVVEQALDQTMFKGWTTNDATASISNENPWWDGAFGTAKDGGGVMFGNGNVNWLEYADITGWEKMTIKGTGGELRVMFNRVADQGALTEIKVSATEEGTVIDLAKEFAGKEYVHLNCIKVQWGANATVNSITLSKEVLVSNEYVELTMEDIAAAADPSKAFSGKLEGSSNIELNPDKEFGKVAKITDMDGNKVALTPITLIGNKVSFSSEEGITRGDYIITFAKNTFVVNGKLYDKTVSCYLAVGKKDAAAEEAAGIAYDEIGSFEEMKESFCYGVNVFQYAPGLKDKIAAAIEQAKTYNDFFVEEEDIYNMVIGNLRDYMKSIRPNLPKAESKYAIKHQWTGLYLNIDGDKVTLQKDPYPVQFHLTEASEGPWDSKYSYYDQIDWTQHLCYIYSTQERKYLGYEDEDREEEIDGETYTYRELATTNKKNTEWLIEAYDWNDWYLSVPVPNNKKDYWMDLGTLGKYDFSEDGEEVDYEGIPVSLLKSGYYGHYDDLDNIWSEYGHTLWFIEDYIEPETTEPSTGNSESSEEATAINSTSATVAPAAIFNANGARVNAMQKGVNIVKMTDGTVRKVIVK